MRYPAPHTPHSVTRVILLPLLAAGLVGLSEPQAAMAQNRQPAATRSQEEDGYLLGGGDRVKIDFFNVPEYSGEYSGSHLGEV